MQQSSVIAVPPVKHGDVLDVVTAQQSRRSRGFILTRLVSAAGGAIALSHDVAKACEHDDDELDALVCALIARAVQIGLSDPIPRGMRWVAVREG